MRESYHRTQERESIENRYRVYREAAEALGWTPKNLDEWLNS